MLADFRDFARRSDGNSKVRQGGESRKESLTFHFAWDGRRGGIKDKLVSGLADAVRDCARQIRSFEDFQLEPLAESTLLERLYRNTFVPERGLVENDPNKDREVRSR